MSIPQIPTSRKTEYLVYLGFTGCITLFILTNLPPNLRTIIESQIVLFITVVPTALAGLLFAVRMDKIVDRIIGRYVSKEKRVKKIVEFIGQVLVFLRFWEISPTRVESIEGQANQSIKSVIEGEDLHEEVWTQKGIFFLILSISTIGITILVSETAVDNFVLLLVGILLSIGLPVFLSLVWRWRYRKFSDRCVKVLEFRYYQDKLLTERLMRTTRKPRSKRDSDTQSQMSERYAIIRWDLDENSEYKDALVKQCDEIDKILLRKEWIRFDSQFESIIKLLRKTVNEFLEKYAEGFYILGLAENLSESTSSDIGFTFIRFKSLSVVLSYFSENYANIKKLFEPKKDKQSDLSHLLEIVNPLELDIYFIKLIALAASTSMNVMIDEQASNQVVSWLKGEPSISLAAIKILGEVNSFVLDKILESKSFTQDEDIAESVLEGVEFVAYRDAMMAFHILAVLPKNQDTLNGVIAFLSAAVVSDDHDVQLLAIDAIGLIGSDALNNVQARISILLALEKKDDEITLAIAYGLLNSLSALKKYPTLISKIETYLPLKNHFVQNVLLQVLRGCRKGDVKYSQLLYDISLKETPAEFIPEFGLTCKELVKRAKSTDPETATSALMELWHRPDGCISESEDLLSVIVSTDQNPIRQSTIALLAKNIDRLEMNVLDYSKKIFDVSKDITSPEIRYTLANVLGRMGNVVSFESTRRLSQKDYVALAALSLHYLGPSGYSDPNLIQELTRAIDSRNSDSIVPCLLAVKTIGELARIHHSLLDKVLELAESNAVVIAACALDCLNSIGGSRVHNELGKLEGRFNHWWLRKLFRKTLQT